MIFIGVSLKFGRPDYAIPGMGGSVIFHLDGIKRSRKRVKAGQRV
jgi:hypothetical protein